MFERNDDIARNTLEVLQRQFEQSADAIADGFPR